jgi:23S rRNA (guanosine2251-2'-O)-methyltransferase
MSEYIYGKNAVKATLENPKRVIELFVEEKEQEMIQLAIKKKIPYQVVSRKKLDQLVTGLHQGVVCEVEGYPLTDLEQLIREARATYPILIMLDGIEDPHNLGAILRSADATEWMASSYQKIAVSV